MHRRLVVKEVTCVCSTVAEELKGVAVEIPGPGLRDHVDHIAGTEAKLRREAVGLQPEFLRLIDSRRVHDCSPLPVGIPMAVQQPFGISKSATREVEEGKILIGVGRIRARSSGPLSEGLVCDGSIQEYEARDIPLIERKIKDLPGVYEGGDICIFRIQLRRLRCDHDLFRNARQRKRNGNLKRLAYFQDDVGLGIGAETLFLDRQRVLPRRQQGERIQPRSACLFLALKMLIRTDERYRCVWNDGTCFVGHRPGECCADRLGLA